MLNSKRNIYDQNFYLGGGGQGWWMGREVAVKDA